MTVRPILRIATVLASMSIPIAVANPAQAYDTWETHRLKFGVVGQQYWLDSSAVANNESAILGGVSKWNGTSTPISYSRTVVQANSHLDFYRQASVDGYCAATQHYVSTTRINPASQNWWWAKVTTRPSLKDNIPGCGTASHRDAVIAHEVGHAMGLDHSSSSGVLMYIDIAGTVIDGPRADDVAGINYLY